MILTDTHRDQFLATARHWLVRMRDGEHRELARDIEAAFRAFQGSPADRAVRLPRTVLLAATKAGKAAGREAWRCKDPFITCHIDLAFRLWLEGDDGMHRAIRQHGLGPVFSIVALVDQHTAGLDALLRVNELLASLLSAEVEAERRVAQEYERQAASREKSNAALPRARKESAKNRWRAAQELKERAREMARDYYRRHPGHATVDVVTHIRKRQHDLNKSDSWFEKVLAGVKTAALHSVVTG